MKASVAYRFRRSLGIFAAFASPRASFPSSLEGDLRVCVCVCVFAALRHLPG